MGRGSETSLAPGFRFHPTDVELVSFYLKRRVCNKPFKFDAVSVTDVYKSEPWDLPVKSKLKSRDLEWYFYSRLDKKYANGSKTNRATENGYWKTTGKDREILNGSRVVGMKKTLVYHKGRAPRGERTNWVMHEYRLSDEVLKKAEVPPQDAYVLCRIFQKSGTGPKNGEQYGAPFLEEEWEEDEMTYVPAQDAFSEELAFDDDDVYVDFDEIDEKPENVVVYDAVPIGSNYGHGESSNNVESGNFSDSGNYIQPENYVVDSNGGYYEQPIETFEEDKKPIIRDGSIQPCSLFPDEQIGCVQDENAVNLESSNNNVFVTDNCFSDIPIDTNYLPDEPFMDPNYNLPLDDGLYLETNDLGFAQQDGFNLEDYLNFDYEDPQNFTLDDSQLTGFEDALPNQEGLEQKPSLEELEKVVAEGKEAVEKIESGEGSSSKQDADFTDFDDSAAKYPFLKKASHCFGAIPAPPFASEFKSKDSAIRLHAAQSSGSVHVTAGMIRISDMTLSADTGMGWSYDKNGNLNVVLSFGLVQRDNAMSSTESKTGTTATRAMLIFICLWVLILTVSFKIGTIVSAR